MMKLTLLLTFLAAILALACAKLHEMEGYEPDPKVQFSPIEECQFESSTERGCMLCCKGWLGDRNLWKFDAKKHECLCEDNNRFDYKNPRI